MNSTTSALNKPHWSFWLIGLIALIWNTMGCLNFFMQLSPEMLASMPESHRSMAEQRPMWATTAFAISVFSGVLAGIFLLLKKSVCYPLFIVSLLGAVVAMIHAIAMGSALSVFSPGEIALGVLGPIVLGIFLVWYARHAQSNRWIA